MVCAASIQNGEPDQAHNFQAFMNLHDFDHPNAFDWDTLRECVADLKSSKAVNIPVYSFVQHQRTNETQYLYGASVIIVEGIFLMSDPALRNLMNMKIFGKWRRNVLTTCLK